MSPYSCWVNPFYLSAARKRVHGNRRIGCVSAELPWFSSARLAVTYLPTTTTTTPRRRHHLPPIQLQLIPLFLRHLPARSFWYSTTLASSPDVIFLSRIQRESLLWNLPKNTFSTTFHLKSFNERGLLVLGFNVSHNIDNDYILIQILVVGQRQCWHVKQLKKPWQPKVWRLYDPV